MKDDDGYFDERVAARYDTSSAEMFDPAVVDPVIDLLFEFAGPRRALELGIGTGRIALPLAQRGVPVHGIELSRAIVARLRERWAGWKHEPFASDSRQHVSVWEKPAIVQSVSARATHE